jgi:hypothetical protein
MSELRGSRLVKLGYGFAATLWCASLLLPAAELNGSMRLPGYRAFMIGIDAISAGVPGWLANPVALAAMLAGIFRWCGTAAALAAIACALSLSSLVAADAARADGLPINEVEFEIGFYLWITAFFLIFAASGQAYLQSRRAAAAPRR